MCGCVDQSRHQPATSTTFETSSSLIELTSSTVTSTTTPVTSTTLYVFKYPELEDCEKMRDKARDDCYYDVAVYRGDFSLCKEVGNNILRTVCIAAQRGDEKICDFIEDLEVRDKCYLGVALTVKDPDICELIGNKHIENTCYLNLARKTGRRDICDRIAHATLRGICTDIFGA